MWRRWRYGKKPDNRLIITIYAIDSKRFIISLERLAVKAGATVAGASRAEGIYPFIAFAGKNPVNHSLKNKEISNGKLPKICDDWPNDNTASFRKMGAPKNDSQAH